MPDFSGWFKGKLSYWSVLIFLILIAYLIIQPILAKISDTRPILAYVLALPIIFALFALFAGLAITAIMKKEMGRMADKNAVEEKKVLKKRLSSNQSSSKTTSKIVK